jgi:hypothetical protein
MRSSRAAVSRYDVHQWVADFLAHAEAAPTADIDGTRLASHDCAACGAFLETP